MLSSTPSLMRGEVGKSADFILLDRNILKLANTGHADAPARFGLIQLCILSEPARRLVDSSFGAIVLPNL